LAQEYGAAKNNFGFLTDAIAAFRTIFDLALTPYLWNRLTGPAVVALGLTLEHEIARFILLSIVASPLELAISMPLSAWKTFVIEAKYGFNHHTVRSWLSDTCKEFAVEQLMGFAMMVPLVLVLRNLGELAWLYAWAFITVMVLVFNMIFPTVIAPIFNTFKPLEAGEVRDAIERLISTSGLPCNKIFEVDGSRQSAHSNAYVSGFFGTRRIVVYDTLLKHLEHRTNDISAVVAHEIGHAVLQHNYLLLAHVAVQIFMTFFTFGLCTSDPNLVTDFGYDAPCTFLKLQAFFLLYNGALSPVLGPLLSAFTRSLEFAADKYAVELGFDLRPALKTISKKNLGDANPDPLVSLCHDSHPTLVQRCEAVEALLAARKAKSD